MASSPFTPMPRELVTDRLRLRPLREADSPTIRDLWSERDPRVPRRIDSSGRPSVQDIREHIEAQLVGAENSGLSLLVVERRSWQPHGRLGFSDSGRRTEDPTHGDTVCMVCDL